MNRLQANLCLLCVTLCWSAEVVLYACIPKGVPAFATSCVTSFTAAALLFFPFRTRIAAAVREGRRRHRQCASLDFDRRLCGELSRPPLRLVLLEARLARTIRPSDAPGPVAAMPCRLCVQPGIPGDPHARRRDRLSRGGHFPLRMVGCRQHSRLPHPARHPARDSPSGGVRIQPMNTEKPRIDIIPQCHSRETRRLFQ